MATVNSISRDAACNSLPRDSCNIYCIVCMKVVVHKGILDSRMLYKAAFVQLGICKLAIFND